MAQDSFDKSGKFRNRIDQLARAVYATPDVGAAKGRGAKSASGRSRLGGSLSATWENRLMGLEDGWTALGNTGLPELPPESPTVSTEFDFWGME
jgi:hypothetical protein